MQRWGLGGRVAQPAGRRAGTVAACRPHRRSSMPRPPPTLPQAGRSPGGRAAAAAAAPRHQPCRPACRRAACPCPCARWRGRAAPPPLRPSPRPPPRRCHSPCPSWPSACAAWGRACGRGAEVEGRWVLGVWWGAGQGELKQPPRPPRCGSSSWVLRSRVAKRVVHDVLQMKRGIHGRQRQRLLGAGAPQHSRGRAPAPPSKPQAAGGRSGPLSSTHMPPLCPTCLVLLRQRGQALQVGGVLHRKDAEQGGWADGCWGAPLPNEHPTRQGKPPFAPTSMFCTTRCVMQFQCRPAAGLGGERAENVQHLGAAAQRRQQRHHQACCSCP